MRTGYRTEMLLLLLGTAGSAQTSRKNIYHDGWTDLNKNGNHAKAINAIQRWAIPMYTHPSSTWCATRAGDARLNVSSGKNTGSTDMWQAAASLRKTCNCSTGTWKYE